MTMGASSRYPIELFFEQLIIKVLVQPEVVSLATNISATSLVVRDHVIEINSIGYRLDTPYDNESRVEDNYTNYNCTNVNTKFNSE
ncbi:Uncharacterized protein APZ42_024180 [Daphnia magna]|uniref:Uncharacterized protein n=1 Tax=Daphnia magna TaxID=35525 RepID=A0A164UHF2_9CRUS|nr:Uncharacterized protein APZ42_024180 [Daphnia magna]